MDAPPQNPTDDPQSAPERRRFGPGAVLRRLGRPLRIALDKRFLGLARQIDERQLELRREIDALRADSRRLSERVTRLAAGPGSLAASRPAPAPTASGVPANGARGDAGVEARAEPEHGELAERLAERGYVTLAGVLGPSAREALLWELRAPDRPAPLDWFKGLGPASRLVYETATHPLLLDLLAEILGPDVMLWGASVAERAPGVAHGWHSDIESAHPNGGTASVWLGLEHTSPASSLKLVAGSHRFGITVQEVAARAGTDRDAVGDEEVGRWARELDPASAVELAGAEDGDAVIFDGRVWHGSQNTDSGRTRAALLLQYAAPAVPIRIPDQNRVEWPFELLPAPRPPCVLVRGEAEPEPNRIVPAPLARDEEAQPRLTSRIQALPVPFDPAPEPWKPYYLFRGATPAIADLACHISALAPGESPHEPHTHPEEELLLVLRGEVELVLPEPPAGEAIRVRARRGHLAYYPAGFPHTIAALGDEPANYLMFKWRSSGATGAEPLAAGVHDLSPPARGREADGSGFRLVFEGPTEWLGRLHCHLTTLEPGDGYEPHLDAHDVAIVTLDGEVETLGEIVPPHHLVVSSSGEPHGIRCASGGPARYVVFEFHGAGGLWDRLPAPLAAAAG